MKKNQTIMLALAGAMFVVAPRTFAQITYNNEDLLLNFRSITTQSDPNVTVDLGNVNTFVSTVAALPGGTAVLDSGTGFTASLSTGFSYAGLTGAVGTPASGNVVGFSAEAADSTGSGLLFLTRAQTTGTLTPPTHVSFQQSLTAQANTATAIHGIGLEASANPSLSPVPTVTTLAGSSANAVSYKSSDPQSYQTEGQASVGNPNSISFGGSQNIQTGAGGLIESTVNGSGNVYEALWEVPVTGTGSDVYEGFFTFQTDGEIDFTTAAVAAVPEPSTYGILAGLGLLAVSVRRQFRSFIA
jgi:hypothetical protein